VGRCTPPAHPLAVDIIAVATIPARMDIVFQVEPCLETGGFTARWDAPAGHGGIATQGENLADLQAMITDAVAGYFDPGEAPKHVRLHFAQDPVLALK